MTKGRDLLLDPNAESADPGKPAFLSRPAGSPIYHGFIVLPETNIEGWVLGEITAFLGEEAGDGFVVAPDGTRAGLVWEVGEGQFTEICEPDAERWGVYAVWFPRAMNSLEDLKFNFQAVLPMLREKHRLVVGHAG